MCYKKWVRFFGMLAFSVCLLMVATGCAGREPEPGRVLVDVLVFGGFAYPRDRFTTETGPECVVDGVEATHWHAVAGTSVTSIADVSSGLDVSDAGVAQTTITDPGGCGFGTVAEVSSGEISIPEEFFDMYNTDNPL